jgi:single-strand DNA-binding protein
MNQIINIIGNLGRDPEMRELEDGQKVTNLSVATNRRYTNASGVKVDETMWFRVAVWGAQAEPCFLHLKKGRQVDIEGRLNGTAEGNPRIYKNSEGFARTSFEVTARQVTFLGKGNGSGATAEENIPVEEADAEPKTAKKKASKAKA